MILLLYYCTAIFGFDWNARAKIMGSFLDFFYDQVFFTTYEYNCILYFLSHEFIP